MSLEELKEKFEEDYPEIFNILKKNFGKGGYTSMMLFFFNIHKKEIEDAKRQAKIEENQRWINLEKASPSKEFPKVSKIIMDNFEYRIFELKKEINS